MPVFHGVLSSAEFFDLTVFDKDADRQPKAQLLASHLRLEPHDAPHGNYGSAMLRNGWLVALLHLLRQGEIIWSVGCVVVSKTAENLPPVIQIHTRHLKAIAVDSTDSVTLQDACDECANPDTQPKQL